MRYYALAQRPWVEEDGSGYWGLPPGTIGSVDLAAVGSQNYLFVASDAPFDLADVVTTIGDGTRLDSYEPTQAERDAWGALLGVPFNGTTLLDGLWNVLTVDADPDGLTRAKPIMPTRKGVLELHLGGHSLVRAEKLPEDPTTHPAWPNIQRVLQNNYRAIRGSDRTLARKWLGAQAAKYRLSPEASRDLIVPADLPRELPLRPTTTIADSFNRPDNTDLNASNSGKTLDGSAATWSWNEMLGGTTIIGNQLGPTDPGNRMRADVDLSSEDNSAQFDIVNYVNGSAGPACRATDSAGFAGLEWYFAELTSTGVRIRAQVVGSGATQIFSNNYAWSSPAVARITADGSTISVHIDDDLAAQVTDTALTAGLRTGVVWTGSPDAASRLDNFEAADLLAGDPTGTLATTDSPDTSAISGSVTVSGTLATTDASDTLAASGSLVVEATGTLATTDASDTLAAIASLVVSGSLAATDASDTLAASASAVIESTGTLAATDAPDTLASFGSVTVSGVLSLTDAADQAAATGTVVSPGSLAVTEAPDTLAASGALVTTGTFAATEAGDAFAATGLVFSVSTGTLAVTEASDTLATFGSAGGPATGTLTATDSPDTMLIRGSTLSRTNRDAVPLTYTASASPNFQDTEPPAALDGLNLHVSEELQDIQRNFHHVNLLTPQVADREPDTPLRAMIRYSVLPWDPLGDGSEGWVYYNGSEWWPYSYEALSVLDGSVSANAGAISTLETNYTDIDGRVTANATAITAVEASLTDLETDVSGNSTAISSLGTEVSSLDGEVTSLSESFTGVFASNAVGDTSSMFRMTAVAGPAGYEATVRLEAKVEADTFAASKGVIEMDVGAGIPSRIRFVADRIVMATSPGPGATIVPFAEFSGTKIRFSTDVQIDGDLMLNGTVTGLKIGTGTDGVDTDNIAPNSVTESTQDSGEILAAGSTGWLTVATLPLTAVAGEKVLFFHQYNASSDPGGVGERFGVEHRITLNGAVIIGPTTLIPSGSGGFTSRDSTRWHSHNPAPGPATYRVEARVFGNGTVASYSANVLALGNKR